MHLQVVIFILSFLTTSAYPRHRNTREATWSDSNANQSRDKTISTKDVDQIYKSHIDSVALYNQEDDHNRSPLAEEMQGKLNMESERLRSRLQQELAELSERLALSPVQLSSTVAGIRQRLAPLTQQFQSLLKSNTQDLCDQLSLYLQGLEAPDAGPPVSPSPWITELLERSGSKMAQLFSDFQTKTREVIEPLQEGEAVNAGIWQKFSLRFGQELNSMRMDAQSGVDALKDEFSSLLETADPVKAQADAIIKRSCQNTALQIQLFQARIERLYMELEVQAASHQTAPPSSRLSGGSLQEEFSVVFTALIQDILHSV